MLPRPISAIYQWESAHIRYDVEMKPRDWFGVGIRLFGIWVLLECVDEIRIVAEIFFGVLKPERTPIASYVIHAVVELEAERGTLLLLVMHQK